MRMKLTKCAALLLICLIPRATVAAPIEGVSRFYEVHTGFYRGGQPTPEGFEQLKAMGVRTIINLRVDGSENRIVESLGMKYVHIPIPMPLIQRPWQRIPDASIKQFMDIVQDPSNHPIFVHCRRGADRTGAMVGLYRVVVQKWEGQKAYDEARGIGMRWLYRAFREQILRR